MMVPETGTVYIGIPWRKTLKRPGKIYWGSSYRDIRLNIFCNDREASSDEMSAIWFLAIILMSHTPDRNCRFNRKNSRTRRLILFLLTARPTFLVTVMPNRERPYRPGEKTAIKCSFCNLRPVFANAINSRRFKILSAFEKEYRNEQATCLNLEKSCGDTNGASRQQRSNYPLYVYAAVLRWQADTALGSSTVNDSSTLFGRHSF